MNKISVKEVIKNLIFSFFSYALPTAVLQFIVQPILAGKLGGELNGQYLTLISLNFFVISITATVLNTVRMLQDAEYKKKNLVGDFNVLFIIYALLIVVALPVGFTLYTGTFNFVEMALYAVIGLLYLYHDYIFAEYRLSLQYNKILINNVILVIGYAIGTLVFVFFVPYWQIVFIIPYVMSAVYDYFNTTFIKEPIKRTAMFGETRKKVLLLTGSNILSSSVTYCDKLLLYPLLGGLCVSIYNTAALVGKMLIMLASPLQSVLLSYLVKMDDLKVKFNKKFILLGSGLLVLAYGACVLVGYPLIHLLYPEWAGQSFQFVPVTVASSILMLINNLMNTVIIRFHKMSSQIVIQAIDLAVYLVCTLVLVYFFSLWGFCIGILLATFIKMLILISVICFFKPKEKVAENNTIEEQAKEQE